MSANAGVAQYVEFIEHDLFTLNRTTTDVHIVGVMFTSRECALQLGPSEGNASRQSVHAKWRPLANILHIARRGDVIHAQLDEARLANPPTPYTKKSHRLPNQALTLQYSR